MYHGHFCMFIQNRCTEFNRHVDFLIWLRHVLFKQSFTDEHLGFFLVSCHVLNFYASVVTYLILSVSVSLSSSLKNNFGVAMTSNLINYWICQVSMLVDSILFRTQLQAIETQLKVI